MSPELPLAAFCDQMAPIGDEMGEDH